MNYKKIASILFAKQEPVKVELAMYGGLISGLKAQAENMNRAYSSLAMFASDLSIMKEKASESVKVYNSLTSNGAGLAADADAALAKISNLAKELGISVNDVPEFKDVQVALNKLVDAQQSMDSAFEMLKKQL
jgi:hypothetical protein